MPEKIATDMLTMRDALVRAGCYQAAKAMDHVLDCYAADKDPGYVTSRQIVDREGPRLRPRSSRSSLADVGYSVSPKARVAGDGCQGGPPKSGRKK